MGQLLFILERDNGDLYTYLKREFAGEEGVEIIFDRRHGERRQSVNKDDLRSYGFVIIHQQ